MKNFFKSVYGVLAFALGFAWRNDRAYIPLKILKILPEVACSVLIVSLPRYIINSLAEDGDRRAALLFALALVLVMLVQTLAEKLFGNILAVRDMQLNRKLSLDLQRAAAKMPYDEFENSQTLDEYSTVREFVSEVSLSSVLGSVFSVISSALKIGSYIYILLEYSWIFIIVLIVSMVLRAVCQNREEIWYYKLQEKTAPLNRRIGYVSRSVMDYSNAKEVRVFKLRDFIVDKFNRYMKAMYALEFSNIGRVSPIRIVVALGDTLFLLAAYGIVGYSLIKGNINVGIFVQYTGALFALSTALSGAVSGVVSLKNQNNYVSAYKKFVGKTDLNAGGTYGVSAGTPRVIEFQNLSFKYPGADDFVLENINLRFDPGEKIAIVGRNGAGKTTLIKLLMGLYTPTEGKILLDGVDIADIPEEKYRQNFSAAFQDSVLFRYSIRENLSFDRDFDALRAEAILKLLNVQDRIDASASGIETYVTRTLDEEGSDFSGGERKKLLIARALYRDASVHIFDEPTAELSPRGEQEIYEAIFNSAYVKTAFFISHRLASCKRCSRILVLDGGHIAGDGSHAELMAEGGLYAKMFLAQAEAYGEVEEA